jgi:hypothetical protein
MASDRTLDLGLRLGWQHEFASTQRPITAALSGAPFAAFTVYGATPQPDSAVVSFPRGDHHRGRHADLPALRRRHRIGHRQPRAQFRPAVQLVSGRHL